MQAVKMLTAGGALLPLTDQLARLGQSGVRDPETTRPTATHTRVPGKVARRVSAFHAAAVIALIALSACSDKPPPILPPQEPSLCALYNSYRYNPAAAAVEAPDSLDKHIANERAFHEKCLIDPARAGGPR